MAGVTGASVGAGAAGGAVSVSAEHEPEQGCCSGNHGDLGHDQPESVEHQDSFSFTSTISTRRFLARPAAVRFEATGFFAPRLSIATAPGETPWSLR